MTDIGVLHLGWNDLAGSLPDEFSSMTQLSRLLVHDNSLAGTIPPLPSSLTGCVLAREDTNNWIHYQSRKTEGNCFTDTTNAPSICNLSANQC
eukprot:CAMPEP_0113659638 /NCGR_PEP_ID=MMETSP0017_2-20120614/32470_1 /TAXON_ID=2856 /ORGANISM="Cylindrotheca closterium" /LENGTH=92 /DNA_ID=CAMNT_0000574213 /DNA_START=993 /DNA_END=1271 /DNA_ORIENTATION=+ /assembly_acc=CAM_ASM_000147